MIHTFLIVFFNKPVYLKSNEILKKHGRTILKSLIFFLQKQTAFHLTFGCL